MTNKDRADAVEYVLKVAREHDVKFVNLWFTDNHVLKDIDLAIEENAVTAIMGPSGCGKSTLIRSINRMNDIIKGCRTTGEVIIDGRNLYDKNENVYEIRRKVGMVFQNADSQLFSPVVWEEVSFAPLQLDLPQQDVEKRVSDVLSLLGITHLRNRSPQSLSEGEKRKVALASVLSLGPDVLLLDEPSSDLDPRTKVWLDNFLNELHDSGKTIITATHDLELAADTANRCIVLNEQHSVAGEGPTEEMLNNWDLMLNSNLVHVHAHRHGQVLHHPHAHSE
jgi:cobalt/nickel transport system ATP-binding protein